MRLTRETSSKSIANRYYRLMRSAGLNRLKITGWRGRWSVAGSGDTSSAARFAASEAIIDRELRPHAYYADK